MYVRFQWLHFWSWAETNIKINSQKALLGFSKYTQTLASMAKQNKEESKLEHTLVG